MYEEILKSILVGAFYGGQAALYGYLSSEELPISWKIILSKKFWQSFSWTKASKTILLGMVMGALSNGYGFIKPESWASFTNYTGLPQIPLPLIMNFANTAVIMGVDKLAKFIVRRTPLVKIWNAIKDHAFKLLLTKEKFKEIIDKYNADSEATTVPEQPETPPT